MAVSPEAYTAEYGLGLGFHEIVKGDPPAAGASFALTDDSRFYSRLIAVTFQIVTDGNAANRFVYVEYDDGQGNVFCRNGVLGAVTASTTARFSFTAGRAVSEGNTNNDVFGPLESLFLDPGQRVLITVVGVQAGDQLSAIVLVFERFPSNLRELLRAASR